MSFTRASQTLIAASLISLATPSAAAEIEEVLVTASHQPQTLNQIGSAISRIEANELADQTSTYVADLLRNAAGVSVNQSGPLGSLTQVRMRGAEANHTLVMIDGVRVNDISLGSEFNFANLTNADISHVEVLRGPRAPATVATRSAALLAYLRDSGNPLDGTAAPTSEPGNSTPKILVHALAFAQMIQRGTGTPI